NRSDDPSLFRDFVERIVTPVDDSTDVLRQLLAASILTVTDSGDGLLRQRILNALTANLSTGTILQHRPALIHVPPAVGSVVAQALADVLVSAGPPEMRIIIDTLGYVETARAAQLLISRLADERLIPVYEDLHSITAERAVRALGLLGPAAIPSLLNALYDERTLIYDRALRALELIGAEVVDPVAIALNHQDAPIRRGACLTLGMLRHRDLIHRLRALLETD